MLGANKTFTIARPKTNASSQEVYAAAHVTASGYHEPAGADFLMAEDAHVGQLWQTVFDLPLDIQRGDLMTDTETGDKYTVTGLQPSPGSHVIVTSTFYDTPSYA